MGHKHEHLGLGHEKGTGYTSQGGDDDDDHLDILFHFHEAKCAGLLLKVQKSKNLVEVFWAQG